MNQALEIPITINAEEYLIQERTAIAKSEFVEGILYAMAGASEEHNLITANVLSELHHCFKGRACKVYANDMRVRVKETDYTYPDVVAICGEVVFVDQYHDTLLNPTVIIEVWSTSTEDYD